VLDEMRAKHWDAQLSSSTEHSRARAIKRLQASGVFDNDSHFPAAAMRRFDEVVRRSFFDRNLHSRSAIEFHALAPL
jgi:hypothetical protein